VKKHEVTEVGRCTWL